MNINWKRLSVLTSLLFSSMALFLHGYLGYFSRYIGDDFCSAVQARRLGVFRAAWFWYLNWSGRYSASVLDGMVALLGPRVIPAIVPLTILVWLTLLTACFLIFLDQRRNRFWMALGLATTGLSALFLLAPDIRGSLYWGQGMRSVVPPLIMGTGQIVLLHWLRSRAWPGPWLMAWGMLSFLWALVAGGFSETYASFQVVLFVFALLLTFVVEKSRFSNTAVFLVSGLLGAITAILIVILAPGNAERQSFYPSPPGLMGILTISSTSFLTYFTHLGNSPEKIAVIFGVFSLAALAGTELQREMDSRFLVVILLITAGFMFLCFPAAAYGTSDTPPNRTLILPTYFFLIGVLALGTVCGSLLEKHKKFAVIKALPALVLISVILSTSLHSFQLYRSRSEFIEYANAWDAIDAKIVEAKQEGAAQIVIPVVQNWVYLDTPNDNPKFWLNRCMSDYYGLQVLATPEASPSSP